MTKKHFIALAKELATVREKFVTHGEWVEHVSSIAKLCQNANPNFDRTRFIEACHAGIFFVNEAA